jgi:hypothetical protein
MIIYNVTVNIDKSINKEWLEWIKAHIPQVLATGKFIEAKLTKVLVEDDDADTYSIQYRAHSREALDAYYQEDAERLRKDGLQRFADKMLAFRTELEIVDEYSITVNS